MQNNLIAVPEGLKAFRDKRLHYTVSSRSLTADMPASLYLKLMYPYCDLSRIKSMFGHTVFFSRLYGGRPFDAKHSFTDRHIAALAKRGIGIALNLTNHFFTAKNYADSLPLLEKHHKKGNSVVCANDELALRVRHDFPDYQLGASMIKELDTAEKIEMALQLYDTVVVPMNKNDDDRFLESIRHKDRVTLFGNAACAYTCPDRSCYLGISQKIAGFQTTQSCSRNRLRRPDIGKVFYNVAKFADMGFNNIKLVPIQLIAQPGSELLLS
jgi:hypothetical protein